MDVKLDWVDEDGEPQHMETTFKRRRGTSRHLEREAR
jgi:hypothetical protein